MTTVIYFHNMNKFDGIFILQLIKSLLLNKVITPENIKIIDRNSVFYEISVLNLKFRDSFQILTSSLNSIGLSFLNETKNKIDFNFTYKFLINNFDQIVDYCFQDVSILYRSLVKFRELILLKFNIDFVSCLTISSLAFKILRTHYLSDGVIQNTNNETNITSFVQQSYRGGFTVVINPISNTNSLIGIDRNSSYPASMCLDLPVGLGS